MPVSTSCPSCGAPVVFRSAASIFAVCEYCQSTLIRHDQALEDIGKMAALVEDRSPLQIGAEGVYQGNHFALIGRIQIRYAQGVWNEWHLLFDDMRTAWLSEAAGEYVLTFLQQVSEPLPPLAELKIAQRLQLASRVWMVSNIEQAECIAGQGELPFKVGAGYPVAAVDLRTSRQFATLDYSETPPLLFVGEAVEFAALKMRNLREGFSAPAAAISIQVFRCPACGAPMSARSPEILSVGCASCGAIVDAGDANRRLLATALAADTQRYKPRLPLGSKGRLEDTAVEVIGCLVRRAKVDGVAYDWREYLVVCDGPGVRYRWLTEYNGHWNLVDVLSRPPEGGRVTELDSIRYGDALFKHFATTPVAEVVQVVGQLTWRVRRGETVRVVDYVAPPAILSCETSGSDLNWSQGTYMDAQAIAQAFALPGLPRPIGVYANQPNPWSATMRRSWGLFFKLFAIALIVQVLFVMLFTGKQLHSQQFVFEPNGPAEVQTREFTLGSRARKLAVNNSTSLDNNWMGLDLLLVNKLTGQAWPASRELSFYSGYDDGYWSEGSRSDEVIFRNVPAGTYYLTLEKDMPSDKPMAVRDTVTVRIPHVGWSNFVLVLIALLVFPVFATWRRAAFEAQRWAESDHAPQSGDDEGDD